MIQSDSNWVTLIHNGASMKKVKYTKRRISTTLSSELDKRISDALEGTEMSRAVFLRRAVDYYLESDVFEKDEIRFKKAV